MCLPEIGGAGRRAVRRSVTALNCTLKMVEIGHFMFCIFYHSSVLDTLNISVEKLHKTVWCGVKNTGVGARMLTVMF